MRTLFLKWLLIQAGVVALLTALGVVYGSAATRATAVLVGIILVEYAVGAFHGGRACWWGDDNRRRSMQEAKYLGFWAWNCQITGILSTVLGLFLLFQADGDAASLVDSVRNGMAVVLIPTFVGLLGSKALIAVERLVEHDLG